MPIKWKKVWVSDETYESAGVFDVNGDGTLDIVSVAFWYQGPDFRQKHFIGEVKSSGEYFDDFSTIAMDINGDGRPDYITGGWWGGTLRWRENPVDPTNPWPEHVIGQCGSVETTRAWDIDGDKHLEVIPNTPGTREVRIYKLQTDAAGKGTGAFDCHVAFTFPDGRDQGHGLG